MAILTARQREILALAGQGKTAAQIGAELWVTEETVKSSLAASRKRLGAKTTAQAIALAYGAGEIQ